MRRKENSEQKGTIPIEKLPEQDKENGGPSSSSGSNDGSPLDVEPVISGKKKTSRDRKKERKEYQRQRYAIKRKAENESKPKRIRKMGDTPEERRKYCSQKRAERRAKLAALKPKKPYRYSELSIEEKRKYKAESQRRRRQKAALLKPKKPFKFSELSIEEKRKYKNEKKKIQRMKASLLKPKKPYKFKELSKEEKKAYKTQKQRERRLRLSAIASTSGSVPVIESDIDPVNKSSVESSLPQKSMKRKAREVSTLSMTDNRRDSSENSNDIDDHPSPPPAKKNCARPILAPPIATQSSSSTTKVQPIRPRRRDNSASTEALLASSEPIPVVPSGTLETSTDSMNPDYSSNSKTHLNTDTETQQFRKRSLARTKSPTPDQFERDFHQDYDFDQHEKSVSLQEASSSSGSLIATPSFPPRRIRRQMSFDKELEEERRRLDEEEEVSSEQLELLDVKTEPDYHVYTAKGIEEMKPEIKKEPENGRFPREAYPLTRMLHDLIPPPEPEIKEEELNEEGGEVQEELEWEKLHYYQWNIEQTNRFLTINMKLDSKRMANLVASASELRIEIDGELLRRLMEGYQLPGGEPLYKKLKLTKNIIEKIRTFLLKHEDEICRV